MPINVLVVDDSAFIRKLVTEILESDPRFKVVATARDGEAALQRVKERPIDLIILDVNMPRMDGITFLERLMPEHPIPVVMFSALTHEGSRATLDALERGAVDFVAKPGYAIRDLEAVRDELLRKARAAARARVRAGQPFSSPGARSSTPAKPAAVPRKLTAGAPPAVLVAIGASTGGPRALEEVLCSLPPDLEAGIVITQHMPPGFTASFAARLDQRCAIRVREARHNDLLEEGTALIAPGDYHMTVTRSGRVLLNQDPPVCYVRPSVDVMMESVAAAYGDRAIGVVLTGMGRDGARGMKAIKEAGGRTLVQDEETSVIFSMPAAAIAEGAVEEILPLSKIGERVVQLCREINRRVKGSPAGEEATTR